jgi:hypothetical protein
VNVAVKLAGFALAVVAAFGLGLGLGVAVGPLDDPPAPAHETHESSAPPMPTPPARTVSGAHTTSESQGG